MAEVDACVLPSTVYIWPPYVIGQAIIFLPCGLILVFVLVLVLLFLFLVLSSFSSPNVNSRKLDVYHTSTHGVALVRI